MPIRTLNYQPSRALYIVADENMPWVQEAFEDLGIVETLPGRAITPGAVRKADVLLVRSVTRVDASLLDGSPVRFVGSATIGTDHVDVEALRARGIAFAHAPGSNAGSVVEYVLAALLRLAARHDEPLQGKTVGIIGCGNIGGRLAKRLPALGCRVLKNDPPLAIHADSKQDFVTLDQVLAEADIITLHVPLAHTGPHATRHLFDQQVLERMKPGAWLINTSRGPVVDNAALYACLPTGRPGAVVLDVWENEPTPNPLLLQHVDLATPHIAGYSYDGKVAGTLMLYEAFCAFLSEAPSWNAEAAFAPDPNDHLYLTPPDPALPEIHWLDALVRQMYPIDTDDDAMRRLVTLPPQDHAAYFNSLRKHYPRRRAFECHRIERDAVPEAYHAAARQGLGVQWAEG